MEEEAPYSFEITPGVAGVWTLLSLALFVAAAAGVGLLYALLGRPVFARGDSPLLWLLAFIGVLPLHELVHAAFFSLFGGRPRFGAGIKGVMPYLYVADPGRRFSRDRFLVTGLAPLLLLDLAALVLMLRNPSWSWAAPALVANTSGAIGDLWVAGLLLRFPGWAQVEDRELGFAVWPSPGHSVAEVRARVPSHRLALPAWTSAWLLSTLVVFAFLPAGVIVLLGRSDRRAESSTLWLGPLLVASVHRRPAGGAGAPVAAVQINVGLLFVLAALASGVLVLAWGLWRRWRRSR